MARGAAPSCEPDRGASNVQPSVSIIVPTFNRLEFLPAAIGSVFAQTFTDWELIVADDGSHAPTRTYLQTLENAPRVRVLDLPHSGKPAAVRNAALRAARGRYVAFLDSDDMWLPRKLAAQLESLTRDPVAEWSYTRFEIVDAAGVALPGNRTARWKPLAGRIFEQILELQTVIAPTTVVASRELLERTGAFDETFTMFEDYELWLRLAACSAVVALDEPLALMRRHDQHSGSDVLAWRDRGRVIEKLLRSGTSGRAYEILRRQRADVAAGLARSQVSAGQRAGALGTLLASSRYGWRHPSWWRRVPGVAARALAPQSLRDLKHRLGRQPGGRMAVH
jgi:glycosyltransferase involved in cell wall biosynthesis